MVALATETVAKEAGHWYDSRDGSPRYTIIGVNGKERNTTITDARKFGFVPSVTTVLSMLDKPGLNIWRETQAMLAVMRLERRANETTESYLSRARVEARRDVNRARERGTSLHGDIELAIHGRRHGHHEHIERIADALAQVGLDLYGGRAEHCFAHRDGFGGKTDFWQDDTIIDFKSKETIDGKKLAWAQHAIQIGTYAYGLGIERPRGLNVFVGVDDCQIVLKEWTEMELTHGVIFFRELLKSWQALKKWK